VKRKLPTVRVVADGERDSPTEALYPARQPGGNESPNPAYRADTRAQGDRPCSRDYGLG
jgi:hypothetical protein